jgi:arsenate-mycothiol transferase
MAAGLMSDHVGDAVTVSSAGTKAGTWLNELSVRSLADVGVGICAEQPRALSEQMAPDADVVITLGREAHVAPVEGTRVEQWITDEPSERGIDGIEWMRLVRGDTVEHVRGLALDLGVTPRR